MQKDPDRQRRQMFLEWGADKTAAQGNLRFISTISVFIRKYLHSTYEVKTEMFLNILK